MRLLHLLGIGVTPSEIQTKFDIHARKLQGIEKSKEDISTTNRSIVPISTSGTLRAKHYALEARVTELIEFARAQRMPVSMHVAPNFQFSAIYSFFYLFFLFFTL